MLDNESRTSIISRSLVDIVGAPLKVGVSTTFGTREAVESRGGELPVSALISFPHSLVR
jgi:hypothetical protein